MVGAGFVEDVESEVAAGLVPSRSQMPYVPARNVGAHRPIRFSGGSPPKRVPFALVSVLRAGPFVPSGAAGLKVWPDFGRMDPSPRRPLGYELRIRVVRVSARSQKCSSTACRCPVRCTTSRRLRPVSPCLVPKFVPKRSAGGALDSVTTRLTEIVTYRCSRPWFFDSFGAGDPIIVTNSTGAAPRHAAPSAERARN